MHLDMEFSKCDYDMADFLRKLPNMCVFNDFRSLIKRVWKAWMPKQWLSVGEQLEAGVRYDTVREGRKIEKMERDGSERERERREKGREGERDRRERGRERD